MQEALEADATKRDAGLGTTPLGELCHLLLQNATDAILAVRLEDLAVITANPRVADLTGFSLNQIIGSSVARFFAETPSGSSEGRGFSPETLQRIGLHEDVRLRRADDYVLFTSMTIGHVHMPAGPIAVCIVRDATERRLLERELITKHMALRQTHAELRAVAADLERRNAELLELQSRVATLAKQAAIGAFTAGVAHSVNNPLGALLSTGRRIQELLTALPTDASHDRLRVLFQRVLDAAKRIQWVVEDMRRVHRHGAERVAANQVNLIEEIEGVLRLLTHRLDRITVERKYQRDPCPIDAYPDELQHLLTNLLDNALTAMPGGGTLGVEVAAEGDTLTLAIADTGPGLPATVTSRLFEPFVASREGGTGLGLWMAQWVAQHHRGRLRHESIVPHGARFVLEMPLRQTVPITLAGAPIVSNKQS